jgi:ornithine decarboxylase
MLPTLSPGNSIISSSTSTLSAKVKTFLSHSQYETPYLLIDLDVIEENYKKLRKSLPSTHIFYAVKANPAPEILARLVHLGANFDAASIPEIEQCLLAGANSSQISYGNTVKKASHVARAHHLGIDLFAFDSLGELEKIAHHAPGSRVYCRLFMECKGADWPLCKKFGCEYDMALNLLAHSVRLGLVPYGVSFHVGSQQVNTAQWDAALAMTAQLFKDLSNIGINLKMVNLGGGFPVAYQNSVPTIDVYADAIQAALSTHFQERQPQTMIEPGRWLVGSAGVIQSEVVLISRRFYNEDQRWVYLDIGKYGGLAETMDECIKYKIQTPRDGGENGPVVLAGPTCDGTDVLYDKAGYELPLNLEVGDRIEVLATGAYTSTYSSVGFNGFPPLKVYCI